MIKIILLIVFCILAIFSYVLCKKNKKNRMLSICTAVFSVIMLIAVIVDVSMIKTEREKKENMPIVDTIQDGNTGITGNNEDDLKNDINNGITDKEDNNGKTDEKDEISDDKTNGDSGKLNSHDSYKNSSCSN